MNKTTDWSQYEVKDDSSGGSDWSQYEVKDEQENQSNPQKERNPLLYGLAEKIAQHPKVASAFQSAANSPITEAGISAGPALINALKNMVNLAPVKFGSNEKGVPTVEGRNPFTDKPLAKKTERGFPSPKSTSGIIGSAIGDILGAGTAFVANPASATIPGGLATGFAQGEGGIANRSLDAAIGLLLPGVLHGKKIGSDVLKGQKIKKGISELELNKAKSEQNVFKEKETLANTINKKLEPITANKESIEKSLTNAAGSSVAATKQSVSNALKDSEKSIVKKYNKEYEGFNSSKAGQSPVKDPVKIDALEKEYGLKNSDFSPDTQKLINRLVGQTKEIPGSESISVITGKPTNMADIKFEQANAPKVSEYIDLWKQLRAEVADLKHSQRLATTPEAKRNFRTKSDQLEKFSDSINEKAMGSLSKADKAKYSDIQKGYMNERVPFLEKPLLKNATEKHGEVPDNFFEKLNTQGTPELVASFKKSHPELVKAISNHDVKGLSKLGVDKLKELVNGDFGRFVSPEITNTLKGLHAHKEAESVLKSALKKVQTTELGRKVHANDINSIVKANPELKKPFKSVADEQERMRKLKDALLEEGFKLKEVQAGLEKYKSAHSIAKTAAAPIASYLGIKKSSRGGSDYDNQ